MRKFLACCDDHHQRPHAAQRSATVRVPHRAERGETPSSRARNLRIEAARRTCLMAERLRKPAIYARFCIRLRSPKPSMYDGI